LQGYLNEKDHCIIALLLPEHFSLEVGQIAFAILTYSSTLRFSKALFPLKLKMAGNKIFYDAEVFEISSLSFRNNEYVKKVLMSVRAFFAVLGGAL